MNDAFPWVIRTLAGGAVVGAVLCLIGAMIQLAFMSQRSFRMTPWNSFGFCLQAAKALAALTLLTAAVGIVQMRRWSRFIAIWACFALIVIALVDHAMSFYPIWSGRWSNLDLEVVGHLAVWTAQRLSELLFVGMFGWLLTRRRTREFFAHAAR